MILHDYADGICIKILQHPSTVMAPDSRILICEIVLPNRVGEMDFPAAVLENAVMTMGRKESTEEEFKKLFEAASL